MKRLIFIFALFLFFWQTAAAQTQYTGTMDTVWTKYMEGSVSMLKFSPDGTYIAVLVYSGSVDKLYFVSTESGTIIQQFAPNEPSFGIFAFSPGGSMLVSGGSIDSNVTPKLWNVSTGELIREYSNTISFNEQINALAITKDSNYIIAKSSDLTRLGHSYHLFVWDLHTGERVALKGHEGSFLDMVFSPDGNYFATTSFIAGEYGSKDSYTVDLWDAHTFEHVTQLAEEGGSLAFSPDSKLLASGLGGGIAIWEIANRRKVRDIRDSVFFYQFVFSKDSKYVVSGVSKFKSSIDSISSVIYDISTGEKYCIYKGYWAGGLCDVSSDNNFITLSVDESNLHLLNPCWSTTSNPEVFFNHNQDNIIPNPLNNTGILKINLPNIGDLKIKITDESGNIVQEITKKVFEIGEQNINIESTKLSAGSYFCTIECGLYRSFQKFIIAK